MPQLPWLEYTGQSTQELLACAQSHRIDSLLCAFEAGILRKREKTLTSEERSVLAVMALDREVNNGGYDQFLVNHSRRFADSIVEDLRRTGCEKTALVTRNALLAKRRQAWDRKFYGLSEIEPKLFAFIKANKRSIRLRKLTLPQPEPKSTLGFSGVTTVRTYLQFARDADLSVRGVRKLARGLVKKHSLDVTNAEIEGGVSLYLFGKFLHAKDLRGAARISEKAFDLARWDTMHCIYHQDWVKLLLSKSKAAQAQSAARQYMDYLASLDQNLTWTKNMTAFWRDFLKASGLQE